MSNVNYSSALKSIMDGQTEVEKDKSQTNYLLLTAEGFDINIRRYNRLSDAISVMQEEYYDSKCEGVHASLDVDTASVETSNGMKRWWITRK